MPIYDLTYARHDPAHCLAPGLFRSLKRGERKKSKLDITYEYGKNESMRFIGFEPLGADDMRLLQGIVAFSGPNGIVLSPEPRSDIGQQLRMFLDLKFEALEQDALVVRESLTKMLHEIGLTDGMENIKALKASLVRMSNVTVIVKSGTKQASYHLMSHAFDESDGRLFVALNPRITEAVLGQRKFAMIDISEVRQIKSDPTRLIHQRLSSWIDPGKKAKIEIDTLCGYIWPDAAENTNTVKTRRQTAKKALKELECIGGWKVQEYSRGKWDIYRSNATL